MTGRDECRNFCPENSRKNRKKGLQNRNIHAIIPGVSTRRRTGIGMSPSGKAPDFDSGISSVQIRPSQPYDLLAQSAEQLPFKQWVRGSNPRQVTRATTFPWWLFLFTKLPRKHCFRGNRDCQKRALPFLTKGLQSAARTSCPLTADKTHSSAPRAVFGGCALHSAAALDLQPELYFLSGTGGELPRRGKRDHPGVRPDRK